MGYRSTTWLPSEFTAKDAPGLWGEPTGLSSTVEAFMILEIAPLKIRTGQSAAFEAAFEQAQALVASIAGYRGHELQRCLEQENDYVLLIRWDSVQAHEVGFRQSAQYQAWKKLLHHFYDPFPTVLHYELVNGHT